jgi:DNA helicase II / ATP-dependent DNA helicase PcrA
MEYLNTLNPQQYEAVTAPDGPVLVLAGPGSGKTRVLTHRIIYLIRERQVAPWQIMALTFTNKAAREMRERVEKMVDGHLRGLTMGTFHAICARILRREVDFLPYYERNFVIFDTADQLQLMKQVMHDLNLDDKRYPPRKILGQISNAKNELITPDQFQGNNYISEITKRVYARYQLALQNNQAMDFDDLLMNVVLLFDDAPDVLRAIRSSTATSWSMSFRTPTPPNTRCCAGWVKGTATSSPWVIPTSRSTNGAGPTSATSTASARPTPNRARFCWSKITAPPN